LSAQNLVSPHAFVLLLEHARRSAWGTLYRTALPAPGMAGSTLSRRLSGLESRIAAKTGSIANVNSLSGYLRTDDGRDLTFSIITNATGRPASEVRAGMDALVRAIARETD
jgi:D-alanyl-D-alanine carboxypeptidase/D-alanyl-D-alanine-endopeptidase (penicillin-binding protein 4)